MWKKTLLDRASRGDWCARRLLQRKTNASTARVANSLVQHFGSREDAVTHVKDYFVHKFASPSEPSMCFTDLPCTEPDFTQQEVCQAVLQMKTGKTTGMSHVSVELLRCLVALPLGLHALTSMLNAFLRDPSTCSVELAAGWVILLPKALWVHHAQQFRPIVCGEVFAKLAAKLATSRVVHQWAVPTCCFGSVAGKGLPEALYIAKHAAESSALLPTPPVFVQLDLSQAFDSLFVNSILAFMKEHWAASTGLSASLLRWLLVHSRLRFELFDHSWWCDQNRGTQQGGSHSPTLFGRIVAARFEQLTNHWWSKGERPVLVADALPLWALWFIDDAILLFRSLAQTLRLFPQVVSMLADLGLTINVSKSCVLGRSLSLLPLVNTSKYLGLPFGISDDQDERVVDQLCGRATAAFFANRPLLVNCRASRLQRLRLFQALVTASFRWSLCVLSVKQGVLQRLRVHCVTLLTWLLGGRAHFAWFDVECLQVLRHCVKLWGCIYSELWDTLLAVSVWEWIGHVLRMPSTSLTRCVLLDLHPSFGQRRNRTGPDNSGHRSVIRYLMHQGLDIALAADRMQ